MINLVAILEKYIGNMIFEVIQIYAQGKGRNRWPEKKKSEITVSF